jgi:3-dehydroquinate dehydratase I
LDSSLFSSQTHYKLCISTFGRNIKSLERSVSQARSLDPDLIELRLDFTKDIDAQKLANVRRFLKGNEILTIRSRKEGGRNPSLSEKERIGLIRYMIRHLQPSYVDIEIQTIRKYPALIREINESNTKLIASFHDLEGVRDLTYLRYIAFSAPLRSKSLFAVKIVKYARSIQDNLKVLGLYSSLGKEINSSRLVTFCTGRLGISSRILCLFLGSPYSYASLPGEPVASGQLDIKTMRRIVGREAI